MAAERSSAATGNRAAVRVGRGRRPDRVGQDDDPLRLPPGAQLARASLVTLEDPVEYRAAGLDQIEINPRAGLTFASGLRTILRSDPDIVLVGEIRDEETAQIAFRAAMTGHLVLTTLHAQSAAAAMQRLLDMGVERGIITTAINCFVAQRLARRVCQACAEKYEPTEDELRAVGMPTAMSERHPAWAKGCATCSDIGYKGRVPLFEVLPMTERDRVARLRTDA